MKAYREILVGAMAASFAVALFAADATLPPRRGPDSTDPAVTDQARGNPLGDASLAATRARAMEKKKKEREQALLRTEAKPAVPPSAPATPPAEK